MSVILGTGKALFKGKKSVACGFPPWTRQPMIIIKEGGGKIIVVRA